MEEKKVKEVVDDVKSQFQSAGVDFKFVSLDNDGIVRIKLDDFCSDFSNSTGGCSTDSLPGCSGCGIPNEGIRILIEDELKEKFPEIEKVKLV